MNSKQRSIEEIKENFQPIPEEWKDIEMKNGVTNEEENILPQEDYSLREESMKWQKKQEPIIYEEEEKIPNPVSVLIKEEFKRRVEEGRKKELLRLKVEEARRKERMKFFQKRLEIEKQFENKRRLNVYKEMLKNRELQRKQAIQIMKNQRVQQQRIEFQRLRQEREMIRPQQQIFNPFFGPRRNMVITKKKQIKRPSASDIIRRLF